MYEILVEKTKCFYFEYSIGDISIVLTAKDLQWFQ